MSPPDRCHDYSPVQWVETAMHRMYPDRLSFLRGLGLRPLDDGPVWGLPVVGMMGDGDWRRATCVVASPCIDHCFGDVDELSVSVAADLLIGLRIAEALTLPLVSFLVAGEETHLVPGGTARAAAWARVVDHVARLGGSWAGGRVDAFFVSTQDPTAWEVLRRQTDADRSDVRDRDLDGLYRIADDLPFPRGTRFTHLYEYYRFNVSHYRRRLVERLADVNGEHILVVENLQQIKAVKLAERLNPRQCGRTSHLVTSPVPDITNTVRVSRAERHNRVTLTEFLREDPRPDMPFWTTLDVLRRHCERLGGTRVGAAGASDGEAAPEPSGGRTPDRVE